MTILRTLRVYLDWLVDLAFGLFYNRHKKQIDKPHNPLVLDSASSLARGIREGKLKSGEVVRAFVERILQVNETINAMTDQRFKEAIAEADEIDRKIINGEFKEEDFEKMPFLGVPFTTKESTICKGLKCTFGLLCRKDVVGEEDATVVVSMKKAGAILLGVTNIPQLNMWQETSNPIYGTTNNPYNTTRNVGGSSGGEAAIISACGSPLGIGTDIGGSIRIPAYMCGLFGHKPTNDLISTKGLTFRKGTEGSTIVTAGTITRYAQDIIPFLKVLLGEGNWRSLGLDEPVNIDSVRVHYIRECQDPKMSPIGEEMRTLFERVLRHFDKNEPREIKLSNLKYGGRLWTHCMDAEGYRNFRRDLTNRRSQVNTVAELIKFLFRCSEYNLAVMFNLFNRLIPLPDPAWANAAIAQLKKEIAETLCEDGVLLYPSAPWSARYHYSALFRPWNFFYWAVWNVLKLPVTQVPLGLDKEGLPVGIQVIAGHGQDRLCIAVAKELEKAFGGYVPPFQCA